MGEHYNWKNLFNIFGPFGDLGIWVHDEHFKEYNNTFFNRTGFFLGHRNKFCNYICTFSGTLNMFNIGVQCYETSVFTVQTKCHEDILENNEVAWQYTNITTINLFTIQL